jgi:hypothetical protein
VTMDIGWYFNRLLVMDARELVHRIRERSNLRVLEKSQRHPAVAVQSPNHLGFAFCTSTKRVLPRLEWDIAANEARAEELLDGHWPALGHRWTFTDAPDCWHRAPDTGAIWPAVYFGKIPYRHGNPFGDARIVWEPSRLQQLVSLALLGARKKYRDRAVALFERQLASWVNANPPYTGIHYVSAMECALRLIAVCHSVDLLRNCLTDPSGTWHRVIAIVASHARLIHDRLSLYSSASNHTIAEAAGLIYAGVLFPELERARAWRNAGAKTLHQEFKRQVFGDGGGAEQAPGYLSMVTDLATLSLRLLERAAEHDSTTAERAQLSRCFLDEIGVPGNRLPMLGDSDDGCALSPFFRPPQPTTRALRPRVLFQQSGYTVLRSRSEPPRQILFDHGPLGMAPMHAHGHADALSLTLRQGDENLLIDPGTYSYSDQQWRSYFRSTRAHNTVTVDGADQALQTAPFIWRHPYQCRLVKYRGGEHALMLAMHDGYRRVGVTHWRGVVYDHDGRLIVWDRLTGRGAHRLSLWWHLGGDAALTNDTVCANENAVSLRVTGAEQLNRYRASTLPIAGWQSPAYGVKVPATTIEAVYEGVLPRDLLTVIEFGSDQPRLEPNASERAHLATLRSWVDEA